MSWFLIPTSTILWVKNGNNNCNKLPAIRPMTSCVINFLCLKRYLDKKETPNFFSFWSEVFSSKNEKKIKNTYVFDSKKIFTSITLDFSDFWDRFIDISWIFCLIFLATLDNFLRFETIDGIDFLEFHKILDILCMEN